MVPKSEYLVPRWASLVAQMLKNPSASVGSQRVGHDWATELNWIEAKIVINVLLKLNLLHPMTVALSTRLQSLQPLIHPHIRYDSCHPPFLLGFLEFLRLGHRPRQHLDFSQWEGVLICALVLLCPCSMAVRAVSNSAGWLSLTRAHLAPSSCTKAWIHQHVGAGAAHWASDEGVCASHYLWGPTLSSASIGPLPLRFGFLHGLPLPVWDYKQPPGVLRGCDAGWPPRQRKSSTHF